MRNALIAVGVGGVGISVALVWFVIWLGSRYTADEMVLPFQVGVLVFALAFAIGGAASVVAAYHWRRPS